METLVSEDSPLAAYLEGKGEAELSEDEPQNAPPSRQAPASFAPHGLPSFTTKINASNAFRRIRRRPFSKIRNIYAYAVTSTLGQADNERFLEHFRYIIIASQLLSDHTGATSSSRSSHGPAPHSEGLSTSLTGVVLSSLSAFALVWVLDWSRDTVSGSFNSRRLLVVFVLLVVAAVTFYAFLRRQCLKYLRLQAIEAANDFVESLHSYETVTTSLLTLVQEVELVSRGYQVTSPLPPVSRLEGRLGERRCSRLRNHLHKVYAALIPAFTDAVQNLQPQLEENDLDRFLEVYDIHEEDMLEAFVGISDETLEDSGSLKQLRVHQHRLALLRRILLCSLLSMRADGTKVDAVRWRTAVAQMKSLSGVLTEWSETTTKLVEDEDHLLRSPQRARTNSLGSPLSPSAAPQIRRISALSTGIRSLQAKIYLLREDSTRALSASPSEAELTRLSIALREQYDSIGADISVLKQTWESGRQALAEDISKQEQRMSLASSGGRFSSPSIGGLTAVDEDDAALVGLQELSPRSKTFQKLTGETAVPLPLSPPVTESESEGGRDDEVFEAVAQPVRRSTLTREQRITKLHEEREKQLCLREQREASSNMIRELQSVIRLRPVSGAADERSKLDSLVMAG